MPAGVSFSLEEMETLGGVLFEAATLWRIKHDVMSSIAAKVGADGSILVFMDSRPNQPLTAQHFTDAPWDSEGVQNLSKEFFDSDPVFRALKVALESSPYAAVSLDQVVDLPAFRHSPIYRHVYGRHGLSQVITACITGLQGYVATLTFFRQSEDAPFHPDDVALVRAALPLVGGAMRTIILRQRLFGLTEPEDHRPPDFTWSREGGKAGLHTLARHGGAASIDAPAPLVGRKTVLDDEIESVQEKLTKLSPRENEIAQLVSKGLTNVQIAELAGISCRTVELHVSAILRKLGLNNRTELSYLMCSIAGRKAAEAEPQSGRGPNWRVA